jgi:hypothetical protein
MMRNSPVDVTALLVDLMDRFSDETLTDEKLEQEINRSKAVADLSKHVLSVWNLQFRVTEAKDAVLRPESFDLPNALKELDKMKILDSPVWLTEDEANRQFYPETYIMTHCERDDEMILRGYVVAHAPLKKKRALVDYAGELSISEQHGRVIITNTKDPADGGSMLIELHSAEE